MNKLHIFSIVLGILFMAESTLATVGGPTYVYEFKYNPLDESVYYIKNAESGRGCPPELMKLSLNTGKSEVALSCDEGEKLAADVNAEINKRIESFKYLTPINLKDNRIAIDISFVNYAYLTPEDDWIKNANFVASVYQDNKKITDFPISGCNLKQPFVFGGYAIPGFEKKIILLLSAKGDCFEGGYTYETLHVVGGVSNLDKTYLNFYKGPSALVPNEGTLVVFESESVNKEIDAVNTSGLPANTFDNVILYTIFGSVLALGLGYLLGRKVKS